MPEHFAKPHLQEEQNIEDSVLVALAGHIIQTLHLTLNFVLRLLGNSHNVLSRFRKLHAAALRCRYLSVAELLRLMKSLFTVQQCDIVLPIGLLSAIDKFLECKFVARKLITGLRWLHES